jgi:hypothetical protein
MDLVNRKSFNMRIINGIKVLNHKSTNLGWNNNQLRIFIQDNEIPPEFWHKEM